MKWNDAIQETSNETAPHFKQTIYNSLLLLLTKHLTMHISHDTGKDEYSSEVCNAQHYILAANRREDRRGNSFLAPLFFQGTREILIRMWRRVGEKYAVFQVRFPTKPNINGPAWICLFLPLSQLAEFLYESQYVGHFISMFWVVPEFGGGSGRTRMKSGGTSRISSSQTGFEVHGHQ